MGVTEVKLSETEKYEKFDLAKKAGYKVEEFDRNSRSGRCYIIGADNYIDNDFRSIDDVLRTISNELIRKGIAIA